MYVNRLGCDVRKQSNLNVTETSSTTCESVLYIVITLIGFAFWLRSEALTGETIVGQCAFPRVSSQ